MPETGTIIAVVGLAVNLLLFLGGGFKLYGNVRSLITKIEQLVTKNSEAIVRHEKMLGTHGSQLGDLGTDVARIEGRLEG